MKDHQKHMLATSRANGVTCTTVDGEPETCGAPCPPWLKAAGLPCQEPKGHGGGRDNPHRYDFEKPLDDGTLGSVWFDGALPDPRLHCARCDKPIGNAFSVYDGVDTLCLACSIDDHDRHDLDGSP